MRAIFTSVLLVWCGLVLGVSFVATPAKFLAPSVPLAQLLDVGRWTFYVLACIEWPVAVVALIALVALRGRLVIPWPWIFIILAIIVVMMSIQTFWIRPLLDARLLEIINARPVPPSRLHDLYIIIEAGKLLLILGAAILAIRSDGMGAR